MSNQLSLFDTIEAKIVRPDPLSEETFDYGTGEVVLAGLHQPNSEAEVVDLQEKVEQMEMVCDYILNAIDSSDYEVDPVTVLEKLEFVENHFLKWWEFQSRYFNNDKAKGFADWIAGLPSCFNIEFRNDVIIELSIQFGRIKKDCSDDEMEGCVSTWFYFISEKFFLMLEATKKLAPSSSEAIAVLKNCKVEGLIVRLPPDQLAKGFYVEVKNKLELIGGKWKGGKVQGFVFQEDPTELLEQISNGENRNLKKEFQFFATPSELCAKLVDLADISISDMILEPSAGQGAIVKAILEKQSGSTVWCYEAMSINKTILEKIEGVKMLGDDFLTCDTTFDRIIANPPFSKNQDIDHVRHMYECLREDGRLVSIASTHWQYSLNKKESEFREWLSANSAKIIPVDAGVFKESGTSIATVILVIDK